MASDEPSLNALYPFVAVDLALHSNPVTCVLHGRDRPLTVRCGDERVEGDFVLIRPGMDHEVEVRGAARVLYLNGVDFPFDSKIAQVLRGNAQRLAMDALEGSECAQRELRCRLAHQQRPCSPAILRVLDAISTEPLDRMTQHDLARHLNMSRTQALRFFRAETGMTFRRFKRWTALQAATHRIAAGDLVQTAALDSGFADAAHLTRTFREMFGTTPSEATANRR